MVVDRTHLRRHDPTAIPHNRQSVLLRKSIMGSKSSYCQQVPLMVFFRRRKMFRAASTKALRCSRLRAKAQFLRKARCQRQLAHSHHRTGGLSKQF
jgi:hypothetical protein